MDRGALYNAYLKEKKQKEKDNKIKKNFNISDENNTIILNQNSNIGLKIISLLVDVVIKILKLIFIVGIVGLVTIGATVLLNKELLDYILKFIGW